MATKQSFEPRRARPGETFEFADGAGKLHTFSADDEGVIHPANAMEAAVADSRGLPVARKAQAAEADAATPRKER